MSTCRPRNASGKPPRTKKTEPERAMNSAPAPRVHSNELLNDGMQLIIEHAGREYRLRVTTNGKLILTA